MISLNVHLRILDKINFNKNNFNLIFIEVAIFFWWEETPRYPTRHIATY